MLEMRNSHILVKLDEVTHRESLLRGRVVYDAEYGASDEWGISQRIVFKDDIVLFSKYCGFEYDNGFCIIQEKDILAVEVKDE